ncbi:MAG: amidase [Pirellulaceae bacterium]|nr:amidase [Pirellulaceae bacterium]
MTQPTSWGAAEIARRIAAREVSSREVLADYIARIEAVNPQLNALVLPRLDEARAEAAAADERQARGAPLGPLHGVPLTIKACFITTEQPATIGNRLIPPGERDALLVARLRRAGAILLGKTNLPQMMIWHECDNPVFGRSNNPWDEARTPGGSTGGEAALLAARGSALGLGNDTGGSIRVPCHFCGIHGLKPTNFRLPRDGTISTLHGLDAIVSQTGPMARHVADLSLALAVLGDSSDGFLAGDVPPVPFRAPESVDVGGLTIGVFDDDQVFPASSALRRLVGEAADTLRAAGARIVPWQIPKLPEVCGIANFFDLYCALIGADGGNDVRRIVDGDQLDWRVSRLLALASLSLPTRALVTGGLSLFGQKWMSRLVDVARPRSADVYRQLSYAKSKFAKAVTTQLQDAGIDALLGPPHALPAMQHIKGFDLIAAASYSMLFNLLGFPAGTVSLSRVRAEEENGRPTTTRDQVERQAAAVDRASAGLPIGVQVAGLPWREDIVLAVMGALEQSFASREDYPGLTIVPGK